MVMLELFTTMHEYILEKNVIFQNSNFKFQPQLYLRGSSKEGSQNSGSFTKLGWLFLKFYMRSNNQKMDHKVYIPHVHKCSLGI